MNAWLAFSERKDSPRSLRSFKKIGRDLWADEDRGELRVFGIHQHSVTVLGSISGMEISSPPEKEDLVTILRIDSQTLPL